MFPSNNQSPQKRPMPKPMPGGGQPDLMSALGGGQMMGDGLSPGMSMPMPKAGRGMDPMAAMMGGLGMPPMGGGGDMGGVTGPDGLPIGGEMPGQDDDLGNSPLLAALMGGGSNMDPYGQPPGAEPLEGIGTGDPNGGMNQLMQLLAMMQLGVGGDTGGAGSSGAPMGGYNPGQTLGY